MSSYFVWHSRTAPWHFPEQNIASIQPLDTYKYHLHEHKPLFVSTIIFFWLQRRDNLSNELPSKMSVAQFRLDKWLSITFYLY